MRSPRLLIAVLMAVVALVSYYAARQENPITGKTQSIALTRDQEIVLGLQSMPAMAAQFGGLDPNEAAQRYVTAVGVQLVTRSGLGDSGYEFRFGVLADRRTVNAFALPGGPIFITRALLDRLEDDAQLAGILGHEIGHVVGRHAAERIAKDQLFQGLVGAVGVATVDGPGGGQQAAALAQMVAQLVQLKYGRDDELESDRLGVRFVSEAGYDPRALIRVMEILESASGGGGQPEFFSTHPDPGNRRELIQQAIKERFPDGVPSHLTLGRRRGT
ncbi:MAG: M48 family metalloprotease [candidate division NC10 bacterium]|nr:M48 family metalloprotease [candidate division NC10 bacterium]